MRQQRMALWRTRRLKPKEKGTHPVFFFFSFRGSNAIDQGILRLQIPSQNHVVPTAGSSTPLGASHPSALLALLENRRFSFFGRPIRDPAPRALQPTCFSPFPPRRRGVEVGLAGPRLHRHADALHHLPRLRAHLARAGGGCRAMGGKEPPRLLCAFLGWPGHKDKRTPRKGFCQWWSPVAVSPLAPQTTKPNHELRFLDPCFVKTGKVAKLACVHSRSYRTKTTVGGFCGFRGCFDPLSSPTTSTWCLLLWIAFRYQPKGPMAFVVVAKGRPHVSEISVQRGYTCMSGEPTPEKEKNKNKKHRRFRSILALIGGHALACIRGPPPLSGCSFDPLGMKSRNLAPRPPMRFPSLKPTREQIFI